ncbi:hypothetical protein [Ochrobactrum teleogrylli]|uniref:Uncharacterized protein n=1 Tax=Ochrobactrum teleogrylli TaxID=2479765 RepID=A0ABD5K138_9HYPH
MEKANYQFSTPVLANASERVLGPWTPRQMILDGLVALRKDDRATGRAYTIRLRRSSKPSRANAARTLAAYDAAPADSIVFIQLVDDLGGAVVGDIIAHRLKKLNVAGVVVEGPVRDIDGLIQFGPPIWYRNAVASGLELAEQRLKSRLRCNWARLWWNPDRSYRSIATVCLSSPVRTMKHWSARPIRLQPKKHWFMQPWKTTKVC